MPQYRSRTTTHSRNMAGARALWCATGIKDGDFDKSIIATSKHKNAWKPMQRERHMSLALRAYAAMSASAAFGTVRNVEQIERN